MSEERDKKPGLAPRLRFPEFREAGEWCVRHLGDICNLYQPETISSSSFAADGQFLVYGAGGVIGRTHRFNHEHPEVIIGCRGICGNTTLTQPKSWITGNSMVIHPKSTNLLKEFLFHFLDTADFSPIISGSAQPQITRQGLKRFNISFPSTDEQQKIADCLSSLDEKIAAETQKLDALKTQKKGLMQQLFPREGETVPRLRFPEFRESGEWNEWRLEDALRISATYGIVKAGEFQKEGIPMLRGGDIKDGRIGDRIPLVSTEIHSQYKRTILERNDVVIALVGYPGEAAVIPPHYVGANISRAVGLLRPKEGILADYLVGYLNSPIGRKTVLKPSAGSAQVVVNLAHLNDLVIPIPEANEQQKIADCLSSLDDLIAAQAQKIELLKRHKKGLMQQVFPVLDEVPG